LQSAPGCSSPSPQVMSKAPGPARTLEDGGMDDAIDIERYLSKKDPALGRAIRIVMKAKGVPLRPPASKDNVFQSLVRAVIYQRSSEAAGSAVYSRLEKIIGGKLTPARILSLPARDIRKAGLALSKATYILNLAEWFDANPGIARKLPSMPDDEIISCLTSISGIGPWTVNVLLVFNLGRLDVAPSPDAVIREIARIVYGLKARPSVAFVREKIETWRPYRSIATMYLYQAGKLKLTPNDIRRGRIGIDKGGVRGGT
jgi:DNA-3-methyladenine glycosylase II